MQNAPGGLEKGAGRSEWHILYRGWAKIRYYRRPVPGHLGHSLRARREAAIRLSPKAPTFGAPFDKDWAIACKARRTTNRFTSR